MHTLTMSLVAVLTGFALVTTAVAEEEWESLQRSFNNRLEELTLPLTKLDSQYINALYSLSEQAKKEGDLDLILLINEEVEMVQNGKAEAELGEPGKLGDLRNTYHSSRNKLKSQLDSHKSVLFGVYIERLDEEKEKFTKEGNLDEAIRIRNEIGRIKGLMRATDTGDDQDFLAAKPGEKLIWELKSRDDYSLVGDISLSEEDGQFTITSPGIGSRLSTNTSIQPPFRLRALLSTDSTNVRVFYRNQIMLIFNWEEDLKQLQTHDPGQNGKRLVPFPNQGYLEPNELHELEIEMLEDVYIVRVDGEERARREGAYQDVNSPIGIGPGFNSVVTIERFGIFALEE